MTQFIRTRYLHTFALAILLIYYFFSLIFFGEIILNPHDNLDHNIVYNHIISKVYLGQLESIKIFLSGEFKWYFLDEIFHPINIFHFILNDKIFYFFEEILKKILSYLSFYILAKSLLKNKLHCILGALIYATTANMILAPTGYGVPLMPYFLYLLTSKEIFKLKHYIIIFLVGLNSSLVHDYMALVLLIPLAFFLNKNKRFFGIYIKYFLVISAASLIVGTPLILSILQENLHRELFFRPEYTTFFISETKHAFKGLAFENVQSIFQIPKEILYIFLAVLALLLKNKKQLLIVIFIFSIFFIKTIVGSNVLNIFFENVFAFLKGFNFTRIDNILPLLFALLLIYNLPFLKSTNYRKAVYILTVVSSISLQLAIPQTEYIRLFLESNLKKEKLLELKNLVNMNKLNDATKLIIKKNNYVNRPFVFQLKSNRSFDSYYKFSDYKKIKLIVKEERVMSIGIDPMIAAMNDIKVVDGYHTLYPLSYKKRFRKIISKELDGNLELKNYYDNWGNRVYAFYSDKNNLLIDFVEAKKVGADYVISTFLIENKNLQIICSECGETTQLFLYKIL